MRTIQTRYIRRVGSQIHVFADPKGIHFLGVLPTISGSRATFKGRPVRIHHLPGRAH